MAARVAASELAAKHRGRWRTPPEGLGIDLGITTYVRYVLEGRSDHRRSSAAVQPQHPCYVTPFGYRPPGPVSVVAGVPAGFSCLFPLGCREAQRAASATVTGLTAGDSSSIVSFEGDPAL